MTKSKDRKLQKNLKLFDVYAMATGAMFSSGFFLLPGIAAAATGASVYLAYFVAGILIIPAMLCMAELSSAMPKAGGTYYFLDRSLGPLAGTIGGLGSWIAVIFKSAFALVGMGAYLSLYIDVPITLLAVILTFVFGAVNIFGAKETTFLQRVLVTTLVVILAAFVIKGLTVVGLPEAFVPKNTYDNFFKSGFLGFVGTIGLVFVSYAGLTKVASVAEEIENPDRNIPLGMTLSLITATTVYTLGMMVMINVLDPSELYDSLTPVADTGRKFLGWMPFDLGVILIVVSAIAAFASTGNAGIMSASRYPFAMAKDNLIPKRFEKLSKFGTPTFSIMITVLAMIAILVAMDVESVAKLASAFQLLLFGLISLCVIVMRESKIEAYKPGFKSPFYPWVQIAGIMIAFWLIVEMGIIAIGFTGMMVIGCAIWYFLYAFDKVDRSGAIYHVHERLGKNRYQHLEHELMTIVKDRTLEENLSYEDLISRAVLVDYQGGDYDFEDFLMTASHSISVQTDLDEQLIQDRFVETNPTQHHISESVALCYGAFREMKQPQLVIFRLYDSAQANLAQDFHPHTVMFLFTPDKPAALDIRLAGHLADAVTTHQFAASWMGAKEEEDIRNILMRDDHFVLARAIDIPALKPFIGKPITDIELSASSFIAIVERGERVLSPRAIEALQDSDKVLIVGEPGDLEEYE